MSISKLMELNEKGLLTDEALANALNVMSDEKKKEEEKLENMTNEEWNRQQDEELKARMEEEKAKLIEENRKKAENNRKNIDRINGQFYSEELYKKDKAFLSLITNFAGQRVYSDETLENMEQYELQNLAEEIRSNMAPAKVAELEKEALNKRIEENKISEKTDEPVIENTVVEEKTADEDINEVENDEIAEEKNEDEPEKENNDFVVDLDEIDKRSAIENEAAEFNDVVDEINSMDNQQIDARTNSALEKIKQPFKKSVSSISKAKSNLSEKLKGNKLKTVAALAAITAAVALVVLAPELVGAAALVGVGAKAYSDFNKGRK